MSDFRTDVDDPTRPARPDLSLSEVVGKLGDDLAGLLTTQVEIAKLEIRREVSAAAKGAGILSAGALAAVVAVFMLSAAAAWAIAAPLNEWLGFLIVGVVWMLLAVVFGFLGKRRIRNIKTLPERTLEELRADQDLAKRLT